MLVADNGADLTCPHSERALARVIRGTGARIVHFHHMLHWDSLLLPALARRLGCQVVISVHDFWFNCAAYNQLEHYTGQPCGRDRAHADERCIACLRDWSATSQSRWRSLETYNTLRHEIVREMLLLADYILVPSEFIRDKIMRAHPDTSPGKLRIEPHGVNIPDHPAQASAAGGSVLAYFGGDQLLKGARLVLEIAQALVGHDVVVRIYGRIRGFDPETLPPNVELRGIYSPDSLMEVLEGVDLALVPSFYEESFSMVISECWAHGVPVLASNRGALPERIENGVNGWLVPDMQAETWVRSLEHILEGTTLEECRENLNRLAVPSVGQWAANINRIYEKLMPGARTTSEPVANSFNLERFNRKLDELRSDRSVEPNEASTLGIVRDHWGTPAYRVRFPLLDLERSGTCDKSHNQGDVVTRSTV